MLKNYVGFARDHSGSMRSLALARAAMRDYNDQLEIIQRAAVDENQDTIVSVVTIGEGSYARVGREVLNSNVAVLKPLASYPADACGTPMIESVFELISIMSKAPDANDPGTSFLIMVTTDGRETQARARGRELATKIRELQATDKWTFVFRVPKQGGVRELANLGLLIDGVNVFEWELNDRGVQASTQANTEAFTEYFKSRSSGMSRTSRFYANLGDVSIDEAKKHSLTSPLM